MTGRALDGRDRGAGPREQGRERGGLGAVVQHRAGAVRVDVRHVAGLDAGVGQGQGHAAQSALAVRAGRDQMVGVGGGGVPEDEPERLGPRCGTSSSRCSTTNPAPSPMTNPSRSTSNGPRGELGTAHVAAHRVQPHEAAHRAVADQRVDAAGQHDVGCTPAQQLDALTDGRRAGRAGRGDGQARSFEAEPERQVGGDRARHDHRDGQRAHPAHSSLEQVSMSALRRSTLRRARRRTPPPAGRGRQLAALAEGIVGGADGEGMGPVEPPHLDRREVGGRVEAAHPAHQRCRPRRQPLVLEHLSRRTAGAQVPPQFTGVVPGGRLHPRPDDGDRDGPAGDLTARPLLDGPVAGDLQLRLGRRTGLVSRARWRRTAAGSRAGRTSGRPAGRTARARPSAACRR